MTTINARVNRDGAWRGTLDIAALRRLGFLVRVFDKQGDLFDVEVS